MNKIIPIGFLASLRSTLDSQVVVAASGCYDVLHSGHMRSLEWAKSKGTCLIVGVNSDSSIRALKGKGRPIIPEEDRVFSLAALACVDFVVVFSGRDASVFISLCRPMIWVKGSDYTLDKLSSSELQACDTWGTEVLFSHTPRRSTTDLISRIKKL